MAGTPQTKSPIRVAMVVYGDITFDSRVQREASTIAAAGYDVTVFCLAASADGTSGLDSRVKVVVEAPDPTGVIPGSASPFRNAGRTSRLLAVLDRVGWLIAYARTLRSWGTSVRARGRFDAWHAHDFTGLVAVGGSIPPGSKLIYDVHDLFLEAGIAANLPGPVRWLLRRYESRLISRTDLVIAANEAYGDVVKRSYGVPTPTAVHNCPPTWIAPEPPPNLIREAASIPSTAPVILYHGVLGGSRGIEALLEAILQPELRDAHLVLLGYGVAREEFVRQAAESRFGGRAHVLDPVPPRDLLPWVASADVGAMVFPHATLNLYLTTPNKLFECLAAGVPTVVSNFPGMRRIVMDDPAGPLGRTCDPADVVDIARSIAAVLAEGRGPGSRLRRRCVEAAHERWNWEAEGRRLVAAYDSVVRVP